MGKGLGPAGNDRLTLRLLVGLCQQHSPVRLDFRHLFIKVLDQPGNPRAFGDILRIITAHVFISHLSKSDTKARKKQKDCAFFLSGLIMKKKKFPPFPFPPGKKRALLPSLLYCTISVRFCQLKPSKKTEKNTGTKGAFLCSCAKIRHFFIFLPIVSALFSKHDQKPTSRFSSISRFRSSTSGGRYPKGRLRRRSCRFSRVSVGR